MMRFPIALAAAVLFAAGAHAASPKAATAECNDGSSYAGTSHRGACARHGGVKQWLDTDEAQPAPAKPAPEVQRSSPRPTRARADDVWVNTATKTYHCKGDVWYGKTKQGAYMPESRARAEGFHADHDKACG